MRSNCKVAINRGKRSVVGKTTRLVSLDVEVNARVCRRVLAVIEEVSEDSGSLAFSFCALRRALGEVCTAAVVSFLVVVGVSVVVRILFLLFRGNSETALVEAVVALGQVSGTRRTRVSMDSMASSKMAKKKYAMFSPRNLCPKAPGCQLAPLPPGVFAVKFA